MNHRDYRNVECVYPLYWQTHTKDYSLLAIDLDANAGGSSNNAGTPPPGTFIIPILTVAGPPTWIPGDGGSQVVFSTTDNAFWVYNGTSWVGVTNQFSVTTGLSTVPTLPFYLPTGLTPGKPTWIPPAGTYPEQWDPTLDIMWAYDGAWKPIYTDGQTNVNDANYTATVTDRLIAYTAITAARVVTLPLANSVQPGFTLPLLDVSGSVTSTNKVSVGRTGVTDLINGGSANLDVITQAYGGATATSDGSGKWTVRTYAASSGMTNPMTTTGDIIFSNPGSTPVRLGIGGANTLLHGGTTPSYSAVVEADQSLSDNTTANVSTSKHGYAPKAPNDATKYLDGTGAYSVPPGSGGTKIKVLYVATADVDITNTVTETTLLSSAPTVAANSVAVGTTFRIKLWANFSNNLNADTLQVKIKLDGNLVVGTTVQTPPANVNGAELCVDALLTVRATGATGKISGMGQTTIGTSTPGNGVYPFIMTSSTPLTIDFTVSHTLDITWTWGAAAAADDVTAITCLIEQIG